MSTSAPPDRIDASRAALIVYDACRRALAPADPARRAAMRPVLDAWVTLIGGCRAHGLPIIYTTPVSRADGAVVVRECCWGGDAAAHAYSLDTSMKMYARVRTLQQALAMLA